MEGRSGLKETEEADYPAAAAKARETAEAEEAGETAKAREAAAKETAAGGEGQGLALKQIRKHFSRLGMRFFVGTIVINAVQFVAVYLCRLFKPEWLENVNFSIVVSALPLYLIGAPALAAMVRTVPGQKPEKHSMAPGHFALAMIMCFAIMYITNIIGNMLTGIIGFWKGGEVPNVLEEVLTGASIPLVFVYTVVCAPIVEEYLFRKLIVDRTVRYGQGVAVLLSGLMFGLFHGNLNQFAYTFFLGMFLAFLYAKTGNLKVTIGLHMGVNFLGGVVSLILLDLVDVDRLNALRQNLADMDALAAFLRENISELLLLFGYNLLVYGSMLAGGILLLVSFSQKRFKMERGEVVIPKGQRFRSVILNPGMMLYCVFWIVVIVLQIAA